MLGRPKDDWDTVGQRLADANILALAIDLPGVSEPGDSKILGAWSADVRASVSYLLARPDVRAGSVGIAGASLGASFAALAAADLPAVHSLALISPSLDYRGVRIEAAMKQYGGRPALLVASSHDPYAARTVRELAKDPRGRVRRAFRKQRRTAPCSLRATPISSGRSSNGSRRRCAKMGSRLHEP